MPCAFPKMENSEKRNTLFWYFTCNAPEKTKVGERKRKDSEGETGAESENKKKQTEASEPQQNSITASKISVAVENWSTVA